VVVCGGGVGGENDSRCRTALEGRMISTRLIKMKSKFMSQLLFKERIGPDCRDPGASFSKRKG